MHSNVYFDLKFDEYSVFDFILTAQIRRYGLTSLGIMAWVRAGRPAVRTSRAAVSAETQRSWGPAIRTSCAAAPCPSHPASRSRWDTTRPVRDRRPTAAQEPSLPEPRRTRRARASERRTAASGTSFWLRLRKAAWGDRCSSSLSVWQRENMRKREQNCRIKSHHHFDTHRKIFTATHQNRSLI